MDNLKTFIIFILALALLLSIAKHFQSSGLVDELYSEEFGEHLTGIISNIEFDVYE